MNIVCWDYFYQDRVTATTTAAVGAQVSKNPLVAAGMDEKVICPPPTGNPPIMDPSAIRFVPRLDTNI